MERVSARRMMRVDHQVVGSRAPLHVTAVGGLSVSAPIERRSNDWINMLKDAAGRISECFGYFLG